MEIRPFKDVPQGARWETAGYTATLDLYRDFMLAVDGVEVWQAVLSIEHTDDDSKEA